MKNNTKKNKKKSNKKSSIVTKESIFAVGALFCVAALFCVITDALIFGIIGEALHDFFLGVFGYTAYLVLAGGAYLFITSLFDVRLVKNRKAATFITLTVVFMTLVLHSVFTYEWPNETFLANCFASGETFPETTVTGWLGGLIVLGLCELTTKIGALIIFSMFAILFGFLSVVSIKGNVPKAKKKAKEVKPVESKPVAKEKMEPALDEVAMAQTPQMPNVHIPTMPVGQGGYSPFAHFEQPKQSMPTQSMGYGVKKEYGATASPAELLKKNLIFDKNAKVNNREPSAYLPSVQPYSSGTPSYLDDYANHINESDGGKPAKIVAEEYPSAPISPSTTYNPPINEKPLEPWKLNVSEPIEPVMPREDTPFGRMPSLDEIQPPFSTREEFPFTSGQGIFDEDIPSRDSSREEEIFPSIQESSVDRDVISPISERNVPIFDNRVDEEENRKNSFLDFSGDRDLGRREDRLVFGEQNRDPLSIFDEEDDRLSLDDNQSTFDKKLNERDTIDFRDDRGFSRDCDSELGFAERIDSFDRESFSEPKEELTPITPPDPPKPVEPPKPRKIKPYVPVSLDYFDCRDVVPDANADEVEHIKETIVETLAGFRIYDTSISSVTFGPTVTRYNVVIPRNIPPKKVVSMDQSIAINLQAKEGVNIYPNYEDGAVSIEVPNKKRQFVQLGCMLTGNDFVNAKPSSLMFVMGKDVANRKVYGDVCKMTHMLVAGSSNSGKSVFLGSLIISLIYKYSPEELRLILIDPKKTEFVIYQNLPHLIINEIITDVQKTVRCLDWAIREMERRYKLFQDMSMAGTYVVNADEYNAHVEKKEDKLPKIVVIVDELADLMLAAKKEIEDRIQSLTQKARAAGIHLILATQRPSTDVITGVIKSNLPTRIAFAVASEVDSRVILDQTGAHKLLGRGDFLYTMPGVNTPVRVQSAFSSSEESQRVVSYIKMNNEGYYDEKATAFINCVRESGDDSLEDGEEMVEPVYIEALRLIIMRESASISMILRGCGVGYNKAGKIVEWMEMMGYISKFNGAKARKVIITKEQFEEKYGPL